MTDRLTDAAPTRIALVCLGNICRSPMAHVVLADQIERAGLADRVEVTSSGTGDWHIGQPMDSRAAAALTAAGYDPTAHRARHFDRGWFDRDLILVMDENNRRDVLDLGAPADRVMLFRDFDPEGTGEVPDPYYGGEDGFQRVLAMVTRTASALTQRLAGGLDRRLDQGS